LKAAANRTHSKMLRGRVIFLVISQFSKSLPKTGLFSFYGFEHG
jgi:hypothetical protein